MREVQVICPQCHTSYGQLEAEPTDYTNHQVIKQCCPYCGYPDVIYDVKGITYEPNSYNQV